MNQLVLTSAPLKDQSEVTRGPLRIALIGCGAIAEQMHLPVLAGHEGLKLTALVDRDVKRAKKLASGYGVATVVRDADDLPEDSIDAAILATPPFHHAPGAIGLMRRGIHVLVEKPMALNLAEAEDMCRVAEDHGCVLAVGLYKRVLPVTRLLTHLVETQQWGRALDFRYEWGGIGGYASATLGLMRKDTAGGGVLMDLGPHAIDQLAAIFGDDVRVVSYRDDSRGGIEADCEAAFEFQSAAGTVAGELVLSRARKLANRLTIECEGASLSAAVNERFQVTVEPRNGETLYVSSGGGPEVPWFESYRAEIDDFLDAICQGREAQLSGTSALTSVRVIEECYLQRRSLELPWLDCMPERHIPPGTNGHPRKVLITGAGGFIGGRTAEILALRDDWQVRGMVRSAGSASRLARLPVELIQGDLKCDADVRRAVAGCDAVVHCAVGTAYGQKREMHSVTVEGTRRLAAAARSAGVERFVHISSIGVHDSARPGVIDETTPVAPHRGDWYGRTKALAEKAVRAEATRGLSAAILRPGCVYGPYGFTFVMNPLEALAEGRLVLAGSAETPANTVFVDNLVEAIACALAAPASAVAGEFFPISDGDECTWGEYFEFFDERMGTAVRREATEHRAENQDGRWSRGLRAALGPLTGTEAKAFAKRLLASDPLGTLPRWLLARNPMLEQQLRKMAGMDLPVIYQRVAPAAKEAIRVEPRLSRISIEHARQRLGYTPPLTRTEAQELTWQWVKWAGIF